MTKFTINTILLVFFSTAAIITQTGCNNGAEGKLRSYVASQDPLSIPDLLERKGELATAAEWSKTKDKVQELKFKLATKPNDVKSRLQLATIFITEQRITGEHHYYYSAIAKILDGILSLDANNFEALLYKASLKMSLHQFAEAKQLAGSAKAINPNNAYLYGILVDANVELGNYEEAVAMSDKMQTLKPSLESYSRASYLREIYGDYPGAIAAMKMAVQAGLPGSEAQSWCRNILAELYMNTGEMNEAENAFRENLVLRPSYAPSMAGLAKIETERKHFDKALLLLDSARAVMQDLSFDTQLADVYGKMGETKKAADKYEEVKKSLETDAAAGHTVALDLAKLFIKTNQWDSAKLYAMQEYKVRPSNIDVNKEMAWIAFNQHDNKAGEYLKTALRTNSKNPELLERAALINKP